MEVDILRCTDGRTCSYCKRQDSAFLVPEGMEHLPENYGAYLVPSGMERAFDHTANVYRMPSSCQEGSLVFVDQEKNRVADLGCGDYGDRTLFLTGQCNSNCLMCPYTEKFRSHSDQVPFSRIERYIQFMNPYADYVCITGGEPTLLKDDFLKILRSVKKHMPFATVHILTNGRTFYYKDFVEAYLRVRPYKTLLGIPIHAECAEVHDWIAQADGSFEETLHGLDHLYSAGEKIELRIVTSKLNQTHLSALARMIAKRYPYVEHVCLMGLEMMGNAMINREQVWSPFQEIWPSVQRAAEILLNNGIQVQLYNYPLCIVPPAYHSLYRKSITPSKIEFYPECDACAHKEACGGFFRTTKHMPGIIVKPYVKGSNYV